MFLLTRFLPLLIAVFGITTGELSLSGPYRYFALASMGILVVTVGGILLTRRCSIREMVTLIGPPVLFVFGNSSILFFLSFDWLKQLLIIGGGIAIWMYLEEVYRYLYEPKNYQQHAIEHIGTLLVTIALCAAIATVFAIRILLDVRLAYLLPITLVIAIGMSAAVLALQTLTGKALVTSSMIIGILIAEIAWAVYYLPTHYWVDSLIVAIPFSVATNITKSGLQETLSPAIMKKNVLIGLFALLVVIATAQWVQ